MALIEGEMLEYYANQTGLATQAKSHHHHPKA
jgi:hypothetical protein